MNYKKIIKDQETRIKILKIFDIIPDSIMVHLQYFIATGRKLNLKSPKRYTEFLQWYKLNYRKKIMNQLVDKYNVRSYIESKGLRNILVPLYGVYDSYEEINFKELPKKFVLKTTNGSGTNYLCTDKENIDHDNLKKWIVLWKNRSVKLGREWPYYAIDNKIIIEKFIENNENELIDYKFMCFNGKVHYLFLNAERGSKEGMIFNIYDSNFNLLQYTREGLRSQDKFTKPENYEEMVKIAEELSKKFPHVRVDLYNVDGEIYFGEMTFFHGSGYIGFEPDEFDFELGRHFKESLKQFQV